MTPPSPPDLTLREIWELDGVPYEIIAYGRPQSPYTVATWLRTWGFRRNTRDSTYSEGPCVECREVHPTDEIGPDYRCGACRAKDPDRSRPGPYHMARWGIEPDPGHSDWIALERIASGYRMRCPERVAQLEPVRTYLRGGSLPAPLPLRTRT